MIPTSPTCQILIPGKPRASGDDPTEINPNDAARAVNPARAGMIRPTPSSTAWSESKPRASGDDPEKAHGCLTVAA